ncbi:hypothetical protein Gmet_1423 [Geobacter metallireducens GS-15]|uniref:Uncharacterized protein n=1 Tax=Geobacter metallireducens (strain ATCC 53774 / DSM 7210 / GS-15) TaxID=269799 RepID=Q39VR7_GEOMG|nr:hypothetical protein Gmet_1423 [Geobacter metallireducens GS-15]
MPADLSHLLPTQFIKKSLQTSELHRSEHAVEGMLMDIHGWHNDEPIRDSRYLQNKKLTIGSALLFVNCKPTFVAGFGFARCVSFCYDTFPIPSTPRLYRCQNSPR